VWFIDTPWTVDDLGSEIDEGKYGNYFSSIMPVKRELIKGSGKFFYTLPSGKIRRQLERKDELHLFRGDRGFDEKIDAQKRDECGSYYRYMAQYMCEPIPPGEVHFAEDGWRTWTDQDGKAPWNHPSQPPIDNLKEARARWLTTLYKFAGWDPAVAEKRQSDFTACAVFGLATNGIIYVLDYVYDKLPPRLGIEMIHQLFLPPTPGMPRFWRDRWVWPTADDKRIADIDRCWRPEFVVTDKSVVEQTFRGGIEERQDKTGYPYPIRGTHTEKGRGKSNWILTCLDRYFADGRIRVRSPLLKAMHDAGGRTMDISRKVKVEYDWFMRDPTPDDFLDMCAKASYYWGSGFRPKVVQEIRPRTLAEQMLEGFLRPATAKEEVPGLVEEGSPVPWAFGQNESDTVMSDMERWTNHFYQSLGMGE
jgi:hypothetical protein